MADEKKKTFTVVAAILNRDGKPALWYDHIEAHTPTGAKLKGIRRSGAGPQPMEGSPVFVFEGAFEDVT